MSDLNEVRKNASEYAKRYADFLAASPTSFHAAAEVAERLTNAQFIQVAPTDVWPDTPGRYFLWDEGAVLAWVIPENAVSSFAVFGAHTDSPGLKLKPTPQSTSPDGWGQLCVEVYGGALYNSWLDRELEIAGVIYDKQGDAHLVRTGPVARVPQLAIHLDRGVNNGLKLDPQTNLQPIWTVDNAGADVLSYLAESYGLDKGQILATDLFCVPTELPGRFGDADQFLAAGRQDNLSSVYAGLEGFLRAAGQDAHHVPVIAFFDHEEVGSSSRTGAAGPLLETVMRRTAGALGQDVDRMIAGSFCISADAGHSVHPNYPNHHDPDTRPVAGRGPAAKINANQRYASTGSSLARWEVLCEVAGIPTQNFVSRNNIPCGSTIGPLTSTRTGLATVDVGIPMISMHSAREMTHIDDSYFLAEAAAAFLSGVDTSCG
jgi:Aspartyl aminopeptidase